MEKKVLEVIQNKINPLLEQHQGWIELLEIGTEGKIVLRFRGACNGCGAVDETLNELVIPELKKAVPEVTSVVVSAEVDQELIDLARTLLSPKRAASEKSPH